MLTLFAHPERLWLLLGLILMAAWVVRGTRRRSRDWEALGQSGRPPGDGSRSWVVAMSLVILALGQPQWGRVLGADAPAGHDVVLVVDVSRSMAAEDAVPDRMGVAVQSGTSLLKALESGGGNRAAVVAFAGRGVVRCPLTSSLDAAIEVLRALQPGDVQPGGTDLGAALDVAIGAFDDEEHAEGRTIVVFSDGEDHVGSWASEIDRLRADGIIVHCVAIGDPERGHPLPAPPGNSTRDREPPVETRRSDVVFQALSKATGGALIPLGLASSDLGALFRDRIEPTARQRRNELRLPERVERFPLFVLAAVGVGLAGSWPGPARRRAGRLAFSTLAVAIASLGAAGPTAASVADLVARGQAAYATGRFAEALDAFDRAIALEPLAAVPRFDSASALFQLRRYPEALVRYQEARERSDAGLSIKIDYALGNTCLALGEIPEAIAHYDDCLASTLSGPVFDAVRADAAANREFAEARRKPPTESSETGGPKPDSSKRPRPSPKKSNGERGDSEPSTSPPPSSPGEAPGGSSSSPPGNRGAGGAGGGGQAPPPAGSPESRLDAALKDIKEARRQRPPDAPPPRSKGLGKDW